MALKRILNLQLHRNLVIRNSTISFLDLSVSTLLTLVFTPVLVHAMGIEQFGLWNVCNALLGFLGLFNLGLGDTVIRYVAEYQSKNDLKGIVGIITAVSTLNFGLAFLLVGPLFALLPWLSRLFPVESVAADQIQRTLYIALWGFIPMMVRGVMIAVPKGFQDYTTAALLVTPVNLVTTSLAVFIVLRGGTVENIVLSAVIVSWIACLVSIIIVARRIMGLGIPLRFELKREYLKNVLGFSVYVGLTGIGSAIFSVMDRVVVGIVLGLSAAGYYAIAIGIASKLPTIGGALTQSFFPAFSAWKVRHGPREILKRLLYSTAAISMPCIALAIFLIVFARPLLVYWIGETTASAILPIFRILIAVYVIAPCTAPSFQAASGLGYPWINTISTWLMSTFTIILILLLGPSLGLYGAAIANGSMIFLLLIPILVIYKLRTMPTLPGSHLQTVEFA
jgi:O-antigen/teichoic acid export membrane protein